MPSRVSPPLLTLILRFTPPLPDLPLTLPPTTTTPTTLTPLTRPHLPPHLSTCPLRYIHAGRLLPPHIPLSVSLPTTLTNPTNPTDSANPGGGSYIHVSIATNQTLSPAELALESSAPLPTTTNTELDIPPFPAPPGEADPSPQGFDRLTTAGFTPAEISALRTRFQTRHAHAHTPDTLPSPASLRRMEDAWLDNDIPAAAIPSAGGGMGAGAGAAGETGLVGAGGFVEGEREGGGLEDMLWGNLMGFFWGVGAGVWLCREEGVWSRRRCVGVAVGVGVNAVFCALRLGGGL